MANDRLWIVCSRCDSRTMLFKFYPASGYIGGKVETWLKHHATECAHGLCEPPRMRVFWENDWPHERTNQPPPEPPDA